MPSLRELPLDLQPRNRLTYAGPGALSTAELLAVLLGNGTKNANALEIGQQLIHQYDGLHGLARLSHSELTAIPNIGPTKAATLLAAVELACRLQYSPPSDKPILRQPKDVADLVMLDMILLDQEELRVIMLNTKSQLIGIHTAYRGNINYVQLRVAEILREPIRRNANGFILVHNHPSGDPTPSPEDVRTTEMIQQSAKDIDLDFMDHIIIGRNRFVSLKERGLGFKF